MERRGLRRRGFRHGRSNNCTEVTLDEHIHGVFQREVRSKEYRGSRSMMNFNFQESNWSQGNPNDSGSEHGTSGEFWQEPTGRDSSESTNQWRRRLRTRRNESQEMLEYGQHHGFQDPQPHFHQNHRSFRSQNSKGSKQWSTPQSSDFKFSEDEESNNGTISPPPSYEASNLQYGIRKYPTAPPLKYMDEELYVPNSSPRYKSQEPIVGDGEKRHLLMQGTKLTPEDVVKALGNSVGQCEAAYTISRRVQRTVQEVEAVARSRKDLFSCTKENRRIVIELVPDVSLCTNYLSQKGCVSHNSCRDLHLCKFFVVGICGSGMSCQYGHQWDTDHNSLILSKFHLDVIKEADLHSVIRKVCKGSISPRICRFYNRQQRCKWREKCGFLHICRDYLMGCGKCSVKNCSLNHNIYTEHCKRLMVRYGISTNETERDILLNFKSSLENQDDVKSQALSSGGEFKKHEGKKGKAEKSDDGCDKFQDDNGAHSYDSDSDYSLKSDVVGGSRSRKNNRRGRSGSKDTRATKKKLISTCLATDICGDVKMPEICLYAVKGNCIKQNCRYLHAKSPFHWQVEKDGKWYNFRVFHSKQLEKAYQDVSKDSVQLPPLHPNKLEPCAKELLKVLGTKSLTADFKDMTVKDFSARNVLKIRRISTKSAAVCDHPESTVYEWYFISKQNTWIRYGLTDSLDNQFICSTTCDEIEKEYSKDPSFPMIISSTKFHYKLDFQQMTQTNLKTGMVREIRRRPKSTFTSDELSFPCHWISMPTNEISIRVPVSVHRLEYQRIAKLVQHSLPDADIQKIEELQNPFLWRLLQYKKADLSRRYDGRQMNVQNLFHGIDPKNMETICRENIDWRKDVSINQKYGRGTYFFQSAASASSHCTPDKDGHLYLLLVEVIVGTISKGMSSYNRPPVNPITNELFDTTVDSEIVPAIFVKYDKEEYYPQYIIKFS